MTREEVKKIIMIMVNTYPNYKPQDLSMTVDIWSSVLANNSYDEISKALYSYIRNDRSGFAPAVGQLLDYVYEDNHKSDLSEMAAWGLVSKALRNSTYNYDAEYEKLPENVQRAIGSASQLHVWATDEEFNESVVQSNFMRSYKTVCERAKTDEKVNNVIGIAQEKARGLIEDGSKV